RLSCSARLHARRRAVPSFPTRRSSDLLALLGRRSLLGRVKFGRVGEKAVAPAQQNICIIAFCNVMGFVDAGFNFGEREGGGAVLDRKSTRLNSSHVKISYAVFCLKKKT